MKVSGCIGMVLAFAGIFALVVGILFLIAASNPNQPEMAGGRALTGVILLILGVILLIPAAIVLIRAFRPRPAAGGEGPTTIVQKIDFTGDLALEELKCRACGATLSKDSVEVKAGAVVVSCPFCGTSYQIEEKPKW